MSIVNFKCIKTVEGILKGKRKPSLYNVYFNHPFEIKDIEKDDLKLVIDRYSEIDRGPDYHIHKTQYYEYDNCLYMTKGYEREIINSEYDKLQNILNETSFQFEKYLNSNVFYENYEDLDKLEKYQKWYREIVSLLHPFVEMEDFKDIKGHNEDYIINKMSKKINDCICVDGLILQKVDVPTLTCVLNSSNDILPVRFQLPISFASAFPFLNLDTFIIYDTNFLKEYSNFGKNLYDFCFSEGLQQRIFKDANLKSCDLTHKDTILDRVCHCIPELKIQLEMAKIDYNPDTVLLAITTLMKNIDNLSKQKNRIPVNYYKEKRTFESDYDLMKPVQLFYEHLNNIKKSLNEDNNIVYKSDIFFNNNLNNISLNKKIK